MTRCECLPVFEVFWRYKQNKLGDWLLCQWGLFIDVELYKVQQEGLQGGAKEIQGSTRELANLEQKEHKCGT
jgi:hypothetical protein